MICYYNYLKLTRISHYRFIFKYLNIVIIQYDFLHANAQNLNFFQCHCRRFRTLHNINKTYICDFLICSVQFIHKLDKILHLLFMICCASVPLIISIRLMHHNLYMRVTKQLRYNSKKKKLKN